MARRGCVDAEYFPARPDMPALPELDKIVPHKIGLKENFIDPAKISAELAKSRAILPGAFCQVIGGAMPGGMRWTA